MSSAKVKVWDWPLRVWHWAFAACLCALLYTGLRETSPLLPWHMRCGVLLVGLLLFRLLWGFWGGAHARWRGYGVSPRQFIDHFRGRRVDDPHTAPAGRWPWHCSERRRRRRRRAYSPMTTSLTKAPWPDTSATTFRIG